MEDDLKKKWKTTSKKLKMEDDLKQNFSQILLNLGANLSWGWLSSLRFFLLQIALISFNPFFHNWKYYFQPLNLLNSIE